MNRKYAENVEIIDIEICDIQEITANITINAKGNKLKCFISSFTEKGPFIIGEESKVILSLLTTELTRTEETVKRINKGHKYDTHYRVSGEIIDFLPQIETFYDINKDTYYSRKSYDFKDGIVDCGIFIAVEIPFESNLKIGDFIEAAGRLNIDLQIR